MTLYVLYNKQHNKYEILNQMIYWVSIRKATTDK